MQVVPSLHFDEQVPPQPSGPPHFPAHVGLQVPSVGEG
jgi:hypothetical protein